MTKYQQKVYKIIFDNQEVVKVNSAGSYLAFMPESSFNSSPLTYILWFISKVKSDFFCWLPLIRKLFKSN